MNNTHTGWVVRDDDSGYWLRESMNWFDPRLEQATIYSTRKDAKAKAEDGESVVKVEWQERVVKEVG